MERRIGKAGDDKLAERVKELEEQLASKGEAHTTKNKSSSAIGRNSNASRLSGNNPSVRKELSKENIADSQKRRMGFGDDSDDEIDDMLLRNPVPKKKKSDFNNWDASESNAWNDSEETPVEKRNIGGISKSTVKPLFLSSKAITKKNTIGNLGSVKTIIGKSKSHFSSSSNIMRSSSSSAVPKSVISKQSKLNFNK